MWSFRGKIGTHDVLRWGICFAFMSYGSQSGWAQRSQLEAALGSPSFSRPAAAVLSLETQGDIYMARKMYREAIDKYRQCAVDARIDNKIGIAFHQMSQLGLAKKYYEQALKRDHDFAEAQNNLGTIYYTEKSYRRAISYFKRSLKCSGPVASEYANLGAAYFGKHDYKNSSLAYEQALKLDPDVLEHRTGFGTRIQDSADGDLALFHLYLAETYAKAGSNDRALGYLRKSLEEGLKNRKKLADIPEFGVLRTRPEFQELLAENPKAL